jgi:hypothetical protein
MSSATNRPDSAVVERQPKKSCDQSFKVGSSGCVEQAGLDVSEFQVRVIKQNDFTTDTLCQYLQDVTDPYSHAANTRFATALQRIMGDSALDWLVHVVTIQF